MNSKTFAFFSMLALVVAVSSTTIAQAEEVPSYDANDQNMINDNQRLANVQVMNAQALSRGIVCETGSCFKDAAPVLGFEQTPLIEPVGAPAAPAKSKSKSSNGKVVD